VRGATDVSFADLVRMLAEGIADAQLNLDRTSAGLVEELARTVVPLVPEIRESVDSEGRVRFEQADPVSVSLLELGVTPTFYQFSQATVEVSMDVKLVETEQESGRGRRLGLRIGTAALQAERKLNREVTAHSKLTATLVPVPMPARLEPSRAISPREP
jgi:hypothetical protein